MEVLTALIDPCMFSFPPTVLGYPGDMNHASLKECVLNYKLEAVSQIQASAFLASKAGLLLMHNAALLTPLKPNSWWAWKCSLQGGGPKAPPPLPHRNAAFCLKEAGLAFLG